MQPYWSISISLKPIGWELYNTLKGIAGSVGVAIDFPTEYSPPPPRAGSFIGYWTAAKLKLLTAAHVHVSSKSVWGFHQALTRAAPVHCLLLLSLLHCLPVLKTAVLMTLVWCSLALRMSSSRTFGFKGHCKEQAYQIKQVLVGSSKSIDKLCSQMLRCKSTIAFLTRSAE